MTVAMCVIEQGTDYLLQRRRSDPRKGAAGLIGAFGGQCELGEAPSAACCRELSEETSLLLIESDLLYLGEVKVMSDHQLEAIEVVAHVFKVIIDSQVTVLAKEGELVRVSKSTVHKQTTFTPATKACFEKLIKE